MNIPASNSRVEGNTMLVILMVVTILSAAVGGALSLTSSISRNVNRTYRYQDALAAGDGALDYLFAHWSTKARASANMQLTANDFNSGLPMPTADQFPSIENFKVSTLPDDAGSTTDDDVVISNFRVSGLDPSWDTINKPVADDQIPPASYGMNMGARSYFYLARADVTLRNFRGKPMKVEARRVFEKEIGSPWMYAIFYTDRLEIHPGPEFHVTGWVHTNENLYTAHSSLWMESKVTYVGNWKKEGEFAPGDQAHKTETPQKPNTNPDLPPRKEQTQAPMGLDTPDFSNTDSNANNDGYRELIERPSGTPDTSDPKQALIENQRYYNQADVKVLVDGVDASGNPAVTIKNRAGETLTNASVGTDKAIYTAFKDAVSVGAQIQDNRENATVRLVTVDMDKVNKALRSGPTPGPLSGQINNVIYVSDGTATSSTRRGVRLKNGGIMPAGGVTVVSDNPVYIQGDYNTGTSGTTQPDSNKSGGNPTKNTVPGYQKQSCAVIGDAVMILSNAWDDAKSTSKVGDRIAKPTTVNAAIVSGIVPTGAPAPVAAAGYSGGAENFPRFMETWGSGTAFTYHGSMVQLYTSKQATGAWGASNVYDPPKRNWYFDRQFYTDPPPGTLSLVTFKKSRWYQAAD